MMSDTVSTDHHKIQSEEPKHCILKHLQHQPGHDVTIICRDGSLMTHQLVLACVSPMLRTEMSLLGTTDDMLTISMPDLNKEHLTDFLASLYQCKDLGDFSAIHQMLGFNFASEFTSPCHKTVLNHEESHMSGDSKLKEEEYRGDDELNYLDSLEYCSVDMERENSSENQNYIRGEFNFEERTSKRKYNITQKERKKKSKVWENFSIDPDNPEQCICKICHGTVSYKNGGTSSMMSHLKNEHVLLKMDQFLKLDPDGANKSGTNGTRKKRSRVWEYFSVNPKNANQCICVICNENVNYINKGTSSMTSHLKCEHDIWIIKFEKKEPSVKRGPRKPTSKKEPVIDPETGEIKKSVECRAKRRKDLWKHFESFPNDNLKALCKICQQTIFITEKSSISQTLVKHLNTHDIKLELETCAVCGKTFEERAKRRKHEKNHQAKCSCSYCGKMFSDNTARILHERTHTGEKPHQV